MSLFAYWIVLSVKRIGLISVLWCFLILLKSLIMSRSRFLAYKLRFPGRFPHGRYSRINSALCVLLKFRPTSFPRLARRAGYLTSRCISAHPPLSVVDRLSICSFFDAYGVASDSA